MPQNVFVGTVARDYDALESTLSRPAPVDSAVAFLAEVAGGGAALEFAIGTGRIALPLHAAGVAVHGIEISADMVDELRRKPGGGEGRIPVAVGDMATTRVAGEFALVYLVYNTIQNLLEQDEQVACFRNAAAHLAPGGCFVVESGVPSVRRLPPGTSAVPFDVSARHLGFDTYELARQRLTSHHYFTDEDGTTTYSATQHRFVWPAELDLMARLAGLELRERWSNWERDPFTDDSESHVSVWTKPPA
nr:class I SAM-dependent methyltransferase [Ilumatobacter nonamiensis]